MEKPKIVAIVGPTASGKTALSIELAKRFNGEVISADSRQVYRTLDIGTEKIRLEDMDGIPHHLLDIRDPNTTYSVGDFVKDAEDAIKSITEHGKLPIIAGGTFFYVESLLGTTGFSDVPPNEDLRNILKTKSPQELYEMLKAKDHERADTIERENPRRLIRALEIAEALGRVPKVSPSESKYDALIIGIDIDRETLRARIDARADEALARGLIEETQSILDAGLPRERLSEIGLEYKIVTEYLNEKISYDEMRTKLQQKNWQYARRQRTWLKKMANISWFKPEGREAILDRVEEFLGK